MRLLNNLLGQKFGKLTVIARIDKYWLCQCECGNTKKVKGSDLISHKVKSCGCLKFKHGMTNTRLYKIWDKMKARCNKQNHQDYPRYGGRGITICSEWLSDFKQFYNWAINNGYQDNLTIDRIDVNGNYEPSNCRWATIKQQANNRRTSHFITINNETLSLTEWANKVGLDRSTLQKRIDSGWDEIKAVMTPLQTKVKGGIG